MQKKFISRNGINAVVAGRIRNYTVTAAAIITLLLIGFKQQPDTNKAEVNTIQGVFVFTDSRPVATYTYLGTVTNNGMTLNPQYTNMRDRMITRMKKQYPEANAIILYLNSGGADKADAIKIQP